MRSVKPSLTGKCRLKLSSTLTPFADLPSGLPSILHPSASFDLSRGVINVSALNCPKVKIAPVIDILRKRTLKGLPFCIPGEEEPPSHGGGGGNGGNGGNNGGNGGGGSSGSPPEDGDEDCPPEEGSTPGSPGSPGSPGGGDDDGDCCKSQEDSTYPTILVPTLDFLQLSKFFLISPSYHQSALPHRRPDC